MSITLKFRKAAMSQKTVHFILILLLGIILSIILFTINAKSLTFFTAQTKSYTDCFACISQHSFSTCALTCWML